MNNKKILLKFSGEIFNFEDLSKTKEKITNLFNYILFNINILYSLGYEIFIVIGGGNLVRGRDYKKENRYLFDTLGILNTVINAICFKNGLNFYKIPSIICNSFYIDKFFKVYSKEDINKFVINKNIIIFSGGLGIPYFSTDTTAAYRSLEFNINKIFKLTKVDGVYDKDPFIYKDSILFSSIKYLDILKRDIKILDKTYICLCMENNIKTYILNINKTENIINILNKKTVLGTLIF